MRSLLPVGAFTLLYMLGFGGWAIAAGNREFIFYGVVMVILIALVGWMHARVRLSPLALWLLAFWGLLHMAGGIVPIPRECMASLVPEEGVGNVLYNFRPFTWFPKYDQWTHAFGFFSATIAAAEGLRSAAVALRPSFGVGLIYMLMGMGLGAVNEVVEFIAVLTIPNTNVGGYTNTGWDLVSNMVGATLGAVVALTHRFPEAASPNH
jgi:uncharacterized membrane protein YjdF